MDIETLLQRRDRAGLSPAFRLAGIPGSLAAENVLFIKYNDFMNLSMIKLNKIIDFIAFFQAS